MSVIAEFTVPAEQFALYETLCAVPGIIVEVERVVAHDPDRIMPYFWTSGGDYDEFETGLGELAAELGISRQALSKRFRRAHRTLAENAVEITPPKGE